MTTSVPIASDLPTTSDPAVRSTVLFGPRLGLRAPQGTSVVVSDMPSLRSHGAEKTEN